MKSAIGIFGLLLWLALNTACGEEPKVKTGDVVLPVPEHAPTEAVTIGTGEVTGAYYAMGDAIAAVLNKKQTVYHLHCAVASTGGSLLNVNAVMAGDLQFGLARSDWNDQASKGIGLWKDRGPQKDLRSVFTLPFDGMITLITSAQVPEQIVYNFTKAVFENLAKLQDLHPAFAGVTAKRMLEGLSAPIHPGALKYYKEAGLI